MIAARPRHRRRRHWTTAKARRRQLAKSELLLHLAMTAERWSREYVNDEPGILPIEQWGRLPDGRLDPMVELARTYGLSYADLSRICHSLGDELEHRAIRAGYDDHWEPGDWEPGDWEPGEEAAS